MNSIFYSCNTLFLYNSTHLIYNHNTHYYFAIIKLFSTFVKSSYYRCKNENKVLNHGKCKRQ